jgi:hypothetical protein
MREIEFRGKRKDNGKWIYDGGFYPFNKEDGVIVASAKNGFGESIVTTNSVHLKTVGQYTGLKDRNGVKIFEGDIVQYNKSTYVIRHTKASASFEMYKIGSRLRLKISTVFLNTVLIIGNIHDNPELLSGECAK